MLSWQGAVRREQRRHAAYGQFVAMTTRCGNRFRKILCFFKRIITLSIVSIGFFDQQSSFRDVYSATRLRRRTSQVDLFD